MKLQLPGLDRLGSVGMVGERKALALLCLGFYSTLFFMITLSARSELPEWLPVFLAMTAIYVTAFFGVAAEWFWGRWFATGLGYWGLTVSVMAIVTTRSLPGPILILGVMHGIIAACLAGEKMAAAFDAKPAWREKYKLDEQGVIRVRRSVTRMASSLPALVMFALAPREGQEALGLVSYDLVAFGLLCLGIVGVVGFLRQRTWALFALGAAGVGLTLRSLGAAELFSTPGYLALGASEVYFDPGTCGTLALHAFGIYGGAMLAAATLPFVLPAARFVLRGRR